MKSSLPYFHLFYVLQLTYFPFPYHCLTSITNWNLVGLNYQHEVMSSPLSSLSILTYCYLSFNVKGILPSLNCSWYLHKYACMHACSNPDLPIAIIIGFFPEYSSGSTDILCKYMQQRQHESSKIIECRRFHLVSLIMHEYVRIQSQDQKSDIYF